MASAPRSDDKDPLRKSKLGRTDLVVSKICFGTSALASMPEAYGYAVDDERASQTLKAIFSGPTNFLDTARFYGAGRAEERIGRVIREIGGLPKGFVLSTKLDRNLDTGKFDAEAARRSLEASLEALGLDRVHLLYLHDPEYASSLDDVTRPGGALSELFKMKDEGLAEAVGIAAGPVSLMASLLEDWDFDALISHNRFTLTNRSATGLLQRATAKGVAFVNAAPFASGVLAKGSDDPNRRYAYRAASTATLEPVRRIETICKRHGVPMGAAALQFSLREPRITSTICGVTKPERVEQILSWARLPIPEALWAELETLPFDMHDPETEQE
jgi:D-threo-aldose 1-dehydrogenase